MSLITEEKNNFFNLNENPKMPNVAAVGKVLTQSEITPESKISIGNLIVGTTPKLEKAKGLNEEFENLRRDTEI